MEKLNEEIDSVDFSQRVPEECILGFMKAWSTFSRKKMFNEGEINFCSIRNRDIFFNYLKLTPVFIDDDYIAISAIALGRYYCYDDLMIHFAVPMFNDAGRTDFELIGHFDEKFQLFVFYYIIVS